jgi:hypothetical protein
MWVESEGKGRAGWRRVQELAGHISTRKLTGPVTDQGTGTRTEEGRGPAEAPLAVICEHSTDSECVMAFPSPPCPHLSESPLCSL